MSPEELSRFVENFCCCINNMENQFELLANQSGVLDGAVALRNTMVDKFADFLMMRFESLPKGRDRDVFRFACFRGFINAGWDESWITHEGALASVSDADEGAAPGESEYDRFYYKYTDWLVAQ